MISNFQSYSRSYRLKLIRVLNPNEDTWSGNVTNNFSNRVKSNGFSLFYEGTLTDGLQVIDNVYRTDDSFGDLATIIETMNGIRLQNAVELIGYYRLKDVSNGFTTSKELLKIISFMCGQLVMMVNLNILQKKKGSMEEQRIDAIVFSFVD
ncbi:uncharacterized protein [Spinacia oleracea]|uniref:Uncharacterized protein n=1 Tax=Spinacia oleracea TaxID=3562 RepID=A0ABM3QVJ3_SPIOL|nr:uncharacterized protein LOC110776549 [Spinacia oleracea]